MYFCKQNVDQVDLEQRLRRSQNTILLAYVTLKQVLEELKVWTHVSRLLQVNEIVGDE